MITEDLFVVAQGTIEPDRGWKCKLLSYPCKSWRGVGLKEVHVWTCPPPPINPSDGVRVPTRLSDVECLPIAGLSFACLVLTLKAAG